MARARNIKPGFFKNEYMAECTPWARLCFAGLWTLADREGRLEDRARRIKGELFAFDSIEVEPLLQELARFKFIVRYEVDGERYIQIPKFLDHQTPHYSEKPSVIPAPELQESERHDGSSKRRRLQESDGDYGASKRGGLQEDSKSTPGVRTSSRWGRNPLNPDSLNHESPPLREGVQGGTAVADPPQHPRGVEPEVQDDPPPKDPPPEDPDPPKPQRQSAMTFAAWVAITKARGEKAIPADDPVYAYAASIGLPDDFLLIAWQRFRTLYGKGGGYGSKRYADWRAVFRNSVRGCWGNLWRALPDGTYVLTTAGEQIRREMEAIEAQQEAAA